MLAIKLHTPESKSLVKFVMGCDDLTAKREPVLTEFLKDYLPHLTGTSTLTVTREGGKTEKIKFNKTAFATVKVPYEEIGAVKFSVDGGGIMTVSGSSAAADAVAAYAPLGAELNVEFEQTDGGDGFTDVHVTATLPEGFEGFPVLYADLPYAFRIESVETLDNSGYSVAQNKRSAQFFASVGTVDAILHCYTAAAGEFVMEPVYMIDAGSGAASASAGVTVNVQ